jgi:hypothetical protein
MMIALFQKFLNEADGVPRNVPALPPSCSFRDFLTVMRPS